jgi:hypothetical protein
MKNENRHYHKLKCDIFQKINSINQQDFKVSDESQEGLVDFDFAQTSTCETKDIKIEMPLCI